MDLPVYRLEDTARRRFRNLTLSSVLASALLLTGGCFGGEDESQGDQSVSEKLGAEDSCAFMDMEGASAALFGDSPPEGQTEEVQNDYLGCTNRLSIIVDGQEVGEMELAARVFDNSESESSNDSEDVPTDDRIEWFYPENQESSNEVIESSADPLSGTWGAGDSYTLDGIFRNRDLYIVGAWGEVNGFEFGVTFKVTAEQEYFDQPLLYHEYCDATDLNSGCIVSADVLHQWMTSQYLPSILDRLSEN